MAYAPGSFTKNFAWHGKGFSKLHEAIRTGFGKKLLPVSRVDWRESSLLTASDFYIAANFFLFNVIKSGVNNVPVDELVFQAVTKEHSVAFDRLALFALNLSLGGKRTGTSNGMEFPTKWANEFVRDLLWQSGRWEGTAFDIGTMDAFFAERITGVGRIKCRMNYRHLFELARFLPVTHPQINADAEGWAAPALFLAWDRRRMAAESSSTKAADLIAASVAEEDYKLLGVTEAEFHALAPPIAAHYAGFGGLDRFTAAPKAATGTSATTKPLGPAEPSPSAAAADLGWLTVAGAEGAVERQIQQRLTQKRDRVVAAKLKALYGHECMACSTKLLMGLSPKRFYSEAAHMRPLGKPHNGPDTPANMIVLCPNHHLQFDRGIISVRMKAGVPVFVSRIDGDPINGKPLPLHAKHPLDPAHINWHRAYFRKLPTS